jgi:hypothetical protein
VRIILILRVLRVRLLLIRVVTMAVIVVYLLMTGKLVVSVDEILKHKNITKYGIVQVVVFLSRPNVRV